jgi:hypothetical protein
VHQPRAGDAARGRDACAAGRAPPSGTPAASGCAGFAGGVVLPAALRVRAVVLHALLHGNIYKTKYKKNIDHVKNLKIYWDHLMFPLDAAITLARANAEVPSLAEENSQTDVQTCQHCSILTLVNPPYTDDFL